MSTEIITAALAGGIGTYIVQGLFSLFMSKKQHIRKLEEITHLRKLEMCEKAMGAYNTMRKEVKTYISWIKAEMSDEDIDYEKIHEIYENHTGKFEEIIEKYEFHLSGVELYISLKHIPGWSGVIARKNSTQERDILNIGLDIIHKFNELEKTKPEKVEKIKSIESEIEKLKNEYSNKMNEYLKSMQQYEKHINTLTDHIRENV